MYQAVIEDSIMHTSLGDGVAILDLRTNEYFSLDPVGSLVWHSLQTPRSKAELVAAICDAFDVDEAVCAQDLDILITDLLDTSLIRIVPQAEH